MKKIFLITIVLSAFLCQSAFSQDNFLKVSLHYSASLLSPWAIPLHQSLFDYIREELIGFDQSIHRSEEVKQQKTDFLSDNMDSHYNVFHYEHLRNPELGWVTVSHIKKHSSEDKGEIGQKLKQKENCFREKSISIAESREKLKGFIEYQKNEEYEWNKWGIEYLSEDYKNTNYKCTAISIFLNGLYYNGSGLYDGDKHVNESSKVAYDAPQYDQFNMLQKYTFSSENAYELILHQCELGLDFPKAVSEFDNEAKDYVIDDDTTYDAYNACEQMFEDESGVFIETNQSNVDGFWITSKWHLQKRFPEGVTMLSGDDVEVSSIDPRKDRFEGAKLAITDLQFKTENEDVKSIRDFESISSVPANQAIEIKVVSNRRKLASGYIILDDPIRLPKPLKEMDAELYETLSEHFDNTYSSDYIQDE